jgi:hypothetical protein
MAAACPEFVFGGLIDDLREGRHGARKIVVKRALLDTTVTSRRGREPQAHVVRPSAMDIAVANATSQVLMISSW